MAGNNSIFDGSVETGTGRQNTIGGLTIRRTASQADGIPSGATLPAVNASDDGDLFNLIGSTTVVDGLYRFNGTVWRLIGSDEVSIGTLANFRVTLNDFRYHSALNVTAVNGNLIDFTITLFRVNRDVTPRILTSSAGDGTNPLTGTGVTEDQARAAFAFYDTGAELEALTWT